MVGGSCKSDSFASRLPIGKLSVISIRHGGSALRGRVAANITQFCLFVRVYRNIHNEIRLFGDGLVLVCGVWRCYLRGEGRAC